MGEGSDRRPIKGEIFLTDTEINDIFYLTEKKKKKKLMVNSMLSKTHKMNI